MSSNDLFIFTYLCLSVIYAERILPVAQTGKKRLLYYLGEEIMTGYETNVTTYYGRKSKNGGYEWVVCISSEGCFITDPIEDWEKDNDYYDEDDQITLFLEVVYNFNKFIGD